MTAFTITSASPSALASALAILPTAPPLPPALAAHPHTLTPFSLTAGAVAVLFVATLGLDRRALSALSTPLSASFSLLYFLPSTCGGWRGVFTPL